MSHHAVAYPESTGISVECPSHGEIVRTRLHVVAEESVYKHEKDFHPRSYQKLHN